MEPDKVELTMLAGEYHTDLEDAMMEFQMFAGMNNDRALNSNEESREYRRVVKELFGLQLGNTKRATRPFKLEPLSAEVKQTVCCPLEKNTLLTRGQIHLAPITPKRARSRRASIPDVTSSNHVTISGTFSRSFPGDSLYALKDLPVIEEDERECSAESVTQSLLGTTFHSRAKIQPVDTWNKHAIPAKLRPRRHSFSSIYSSDEGRRRHSCQMDSIAWENPSARWKTMIHRRTFKEHEQSGNTSTKCGKPFTKPKRAATKLPKLRR